MELRKVKPKQYDSAISSPMGKKGKEKPVYPTIRIDLEHIPEAKKWKVGSEYNLAMKVKMVGLSQSRYQNEAEFEIHSLGTEKGAESDVSELADGDEQEEAESDE